MKVVCIDTNFRMPGIREELEYGKVYEASFVFFNDDSGNGRTNWLPVEWESNYLNLEGFSEMDWFPTKNFVSPYSIDCLSFIDTKEDFNEYLSFQYLTLVNDLPVNLDTWFNEYPSSK